MRFGQWKMGHGFTNDKKCSRKCRNPNAFTQTALTENSSEIQTGTLRDWQAGKAFLYKGDRSALVSMSPADWKTDFQRHFRMGLKNAQNIDVQPK
jgi:hypothetical protein